jgi:hypothetical protein
MFSRFTVDGIDVSPGGGLLDVPAARKLVQEATRGAVRAALREWAERLKAM